MNVLQQKSKGIQISLRLRLALLTSGMFVVLCLFLITFINLITFITKAHQLLTISTLGFFVVTIGGGFGAYWIAGLALRPVKEMSEAVTLISATTLSTRLAVPEPRDELRDLANSFNAMLNRLEQAFEQQSRFVADAAHELRTPLATLLTNLEVAGRNSNTTLNDYQKLFQTVERAVARLESLVKALLLLATEKQTLVTTEVALLPLMEEVLSSLQPVAEAHQVMLCMNTVTTASLCGDEHLLALIFRNLIENAIRYNRPSGTVTVNIANEPTSVAIRISDTGIGIVPEKQNHIFERFYRIDLSRSRHRGGAGLGLSIVKHLLDLHNGTVSLKSSSMEGSTFLVVLPNYTISHEVI
jgi:signal transduction histidine kinase